MKIDWYYFRKGWVSCNKAQELLGKKQIAVTEQVDAKKEKINDEQAWARLSQVPKIFISQGKKVLEFTNEPANKEAVLAKAMGRSGNLRAPTLLVDGIYYVGFNAEMYEEIFS